MWFYYYVNNVCHSTAQTIYALKTIKAHGADQRSICDLTRATIVSKLTYCAPAWRGFTTAAEKTQLQSVLNRVVRWGLYNPSHPNLDQLCCKRDSDLFHTILNNPNHVLHQFLPPKKQQSYKLRPKAHNRTLPDKTSSLISKTFFTRLLYNSLVNANSLS